MKLIFGSEGKIRRLPKLILTTFLVNINKTVADTEGIAQETGKQFYWMSVLERKNRIVDENSRVKCNKETNGEKTCLR